MRNKVISWLNSTQSRLFLFPILAGICIFLAFERYNFSPTLFLVPFFLNGIRQLPLKRKLFAFWIMAIVTNLGGFGWIRYVAVDYGGMPTILALGLVLLFGMFNNLNFVLWAYLESFFGNNRNPFVIAGLFCICEQINPQVFPWYFGTALDSLLILYQTADLIGVIGLSFIAIWLMHMPYWTWQNRRYLWSDKRILFSLQCAILAFVLGYGAWALDKYTNHPTPEKKRVGISLIQSNTAMEKFYGARMNATERWQEFQDIVALSRAALGKAEGKTDLVVWPEGSVHYWILNDTKVYDEISKLARENSVYLTAGSSEMGGKYPSGRRIYYNTQFFLDRDGSLKGRYHKIFLLVFGEYIPFLDTLPFLERWLPQTISHFTRGEEKPIFSMGENLNWLPLICLEDIIVGFMDGFDYDRADFMVNITNDGWFGMSDASHLHKQQARARSVEYRKPMVRALNTGTSQVIDAAGRTISRETDQYTREYINQILYVPQEPPRTIYSRIGNLPIYTLILITAVLWIRKKFQTRANGDSPRGSNFN